MPYVVSSGEVSTGIVLNNYDSMYVSSGGTANYTTVNSGGKLFVSNGGTAENIILNAGAALSLQGGKLTGMMEMSSGASAYVYSGTIDFNVSNRKAGDPALAKVYDVSQITFDYYPDFTITVSEYQTTGQYTLADGVYGLSGGRETYSAVSHKKTHRMEMDPLCVFF